MLKYHYVVCKNSPKIEKSMYNFFVIYLCNMYIYDKDLCIQTRGTGQVSTKTLVH